MQALFHATTKAALDSILTEGLRVDMATGKEQAIWLHTASKTQWAIAHTQRRHHVPLEEVVVLKVHVSRSALRRAWAGLWKCYTNIAPARLAIIGTGSTFAASPMEGL